MSDAPTRSERFKADMATMRVKTGTASREAPLQALSVVLMVAGVLVAFGGYQASLNVKATPGSNVDVLSSNSYLALAACGIALTLAGGFLFLRYSLARFLRFWLLRQSYEQRMAIEDAMAVAGSGAALLPDAVTASSGAGHDAQDAGRSPGTS
jgi:hypothetical protein